MGRLRGRYRGGEKERIEEKRERGICTQRYREKYRRERERQTQTDRKGKDSQM